MMNTPNFTEQKRVRKRTIILAFFFFFWFFGLILRLIQLQVIEHKHLRAAVIEQNQRKQDIIPERGIIFDRRGKIIARSLPAPSVCLLLSGEESPSKEFAKILRLKNILDLSDKDLQRIKTRIEKGDTFIWVKRKINPEKAALIERLGLAGICFREENKRYYPLGTIAAHVLGGVDIDDKGADGVELQYNGRLEGIKGESLILRDARKRRYDWEVLKAPSPGKDLILTIDETIQYIAEKELRRALQAHEAAWGTVIIMHPASGEILALANFPTYDANDYTASLPEARRNRAIQYNFEPGSIFKIVTAAAALELGLVDLNDTFDCSEGKVRVAGWSISDHKKMGVLTFAGVIIHSSNVGTIKASLRLGAENLYRMIKAFRFGEKTGIGLPGEENGILHPLRKWSRVSLPSHAIGYEISVTAVQAIQAMNVVANRGYLVPPCLTRETPDFSPSFETTPPPGERIISEKTSTDLIHQIFEKVIFEGTGTEARVEGFTAAGKTGTAQKLDAAEGGYSARKHLASFVGFVPADRPLLSMIVVIDEPKFDLQYGGQVAAPVFREIARRVLLYLRQTPEYNPAKKILTAQLRSSNPR